jgi:hypothetical protein
MNFFFARITCTSRYLTSKGKHLSFENNDKLSLSFLTSLTFIAIEVFSVNPRIK